jgi:hypothetical protein
MYYVPDACDQARYTLEFPSRCDAICITMVDNRDPKSRTKEIYDTDCGLICAISFSASLILFGGKSSGHAPEVCLAAARPDVVS